MIQRLEADVCITSFNKNDEWVVYHPAICRNGRPARMAVWEGESGCRGKPMRIEKIDGRDLGKCVEACGDSEKWHHSCSRGFWCDGVTSWWDL